MVDFKAGFDAWRKIGLRQQQNEHYASALIELKQRVKALEDAQQPPPPADPATAGSLVERVATAIADSDTDATDENWTPEARAAIREVAAWLRGQQELGARTWAWHLEQEAKR